MAHIHFVEEMISKAEEDVEIVALSAAYAMWWEIERPQAEPQGVALNQLMRARRVARSAAFVVNNKDIADSTARALFVRAARAGLRAHYWLGVLKQGRTPVIVGPTTTPLSDFDF